MGRSAALVSAMAIVQMAIAMLIQVLLGYSFGAGLDVDQYFVSISLPQLFQLAFSTACAMSIAPLAAGISSESGRRSFFTLALLVSGATGLVLSTTAWIFSAHLGPLLAPGVQADWSDSADLIRLVSATFTCHALSSCLTAIAISEGRYLLWPIAGPLGAGLQLGYLWMRVDDLGIEAAGISYLLGSIVQVIVMLPYWPKPGPAPFMSVPELLSLLHSSFPVFLSRIVTRITTVSDRWIASWLGPGAISQLVYGTRLTQAAAVIIPAGIATTQFSAFARSATDSPQDREKFAATVIRTMRMLTFMAVPVALTFSLLSDEIVSALFGRGAFSPSAQAISADVLLWSVVSFLASTIGTTTNAALYALRQHRFLAILTSASAFVNLLLAFYLSQTLGIVGVPIAFSLIASINFAAMTWKLSQLLQQITFRPWWSISDPNLLAAFVCAGILLITKLATKQCFDGLLATELQVVVAILLAGIGYVATAHLLRSPELMGLRDLLALPNRKRPTSRGQAT